MGKKKVPRKIITNIGCPPMMALALLVPLITSTGVWLHQSQRALELETRLQSREAELEALKAEVQRQRVQRDRSEEEQARTRALLHATEIAMTEQSREHEDARGRASELEQELRLQEGTLAGLKRENAALAHQNESLKSTVQAKRDLQANVEVQLLRLMSERRVHRRQAAARAWRLVVSEAVNESCRGSLRPVRCHRQVEAALAPHYERVVHCAERGEAVMFTPSRIGGAGLRAVPLLKGTLLLCDHSLPNR